MSEADKMFEKLGYYKDFNKTIHEYKKDGELFEIDFWLRSKEVSKEYYGNTGYITIEELQAINQKCKELGWIE